MAVADAMGDANDRNHGSAARARRFAGRAGRPRLRPAHGRGIGVVLEIAGVGSQVLLDPRRSTRWPSSADPADRQRRQVGSQIKMRVGSAWLIANVRSLSLDR